MRHRILGLAVALILACPAAGRADDDDGPDRLKGRGVKGRGIAVIFNGMDSRSRKICIGIGTAIVGGGIVIGVVGFARQLGEARKPRQRQAWDVE